MFFINTVTSIPYYQYKLLFEVVCAERGYALKPGGNQGVGTVTQQNSLEGSACAFVYQTLRIIPISRLYYATGIIPGGADRDMIGAITTLYHNTAAEIHGILEKYQLVPEHWYSTYWDNAPKYLDILQNGLLDELFQRVDEMIPQLIEGANVLQFAARIPDLLYGARIRFTYRYPDRINNNPAMLSFFDYDFTQWLATCNIDPDRSDNYNVEKIIGCQMENFFSFWLKNKAPLYASGNAQLAVVYQGEVLDKISSVVQKQRRVPHVDFTQVITDSLELSQDLFDNRTSSALQYTVLEWYMEVQFKKSLLTLDRAYHFVSRKKYAKLKTLQQSTISAHNLFQLITDYQFAERKPYNTIDSSMRARISRNKQFLDELLQSYPSIGPANLTEFINKLTVRYIFDVSDRKVDSNYAYLSLNTDVLPVNTLPLSAEPIQLLRTRHPDYPPMRENFASDDEYNTALYAMQSKLLERHMAYIVTDSGYNKITKAIRTIRGLDNLNELLKSRGMSIADLTSINFFNREYFEVITDLSGVLHDRLVSTWNKEHTANPSQGTVSPGTLYWDGLHIQSYASDNLQSNHQIHLELRRHVTTQKTPPVSLADIENETVSRKLEFQPEEEKIPPLSAAIPPDTFLRYQILDVIDTINHLRYPDVYSSAHMQGTSSANELWSKFPVLSNKTSERIIWDEYIQTIGGWRASNLVNLLGEVAILLFVALELSGGLESTTYRAALDHLEAIDNSLKARMSAITTEWYLNLHSNTITPQQTYAIWRLLHSPQDVGTKVLTGDIPGVALKYPILATLSTHIVSPAGILEGELPALNTESIAQKLHLEFATAQGDCEELVRKDNALRVQCKAKYPQGIWVSLTSLFYTSQTFLTLAEHLALHAYAPRMLSELETLKVPRLYAQKDMISAVKKGVQWLYTVPRVRIQALNQAIEIHTAQGRGRTAKSAQLKTYSTFTLESLMDFHLRPLILELTTILETMVAAQAKYKPTDLQLDLEKCQLPVYYNTVAEYSMLHDYSRALLMAIHSPTAMWIQEHSLLKKAHALEDRIQHALQAQKHRLGLDYNDSKGTLASSEKLLIEARMKEVFATHASETLRSRIMSLLMITTHQHERITREITNICGVDPQLALTNEFGFIKNSEGQYFYCKPAAQDNGVYAFIHKSGIVMICTLEAASSAEISTEINLQLITSLDNNLMWTTGG